VDRKLRPPLVSDLAPVRFVAPSRIKWGLSVDLTFVPEGGAVRD
jgi:hypothetical protein